MDTYIVNSVEDFHKYFTILKESARTGSTPDTYLVGFDTEFFGKGNFPDSFDRAIVGKDRWIISAPNSIVCCVVQLATDDVCMVINLTKMKCMLPNNLKNLITNECWIKVGVGVELDLFHLSNNFGLGHCSGGIELRNLALMAKYPKPNLEYMFNQLVGGHIKKTGSICDWSQELTKSQLTYAARDAIMSLQLFKEIIEPSIDKLIEVEDKKGASKMLEIKFANSPPKTRKIRSASILKENFIGILNEMAQNEKLELPVYEEIEFPNAEYHKHQMTFEFRCKFKGMVSLGKGSSKKEAKQICAKNMFNMV